jgi:site-specific recombinase XerD/predicted Zn-ribbon and HTH transcriptional regulator
MDNKKPGTDVSRMRGKVEESGMNPENIKLILAMDSELEAKGRSATTRKHFIRTLLSIAKIAGKARLFVNKDGSEPAYMKEVIMAYIKALRDQGKAETTQMLCATIIKRGFRWIYGLKRGNYPAFVDWIEIKDVAKDFSDREVLTWEDVFRMSKYAAHPRDAALCLFLFETGCRINEAANMTISDLKIVNPRLASVRLRNSKRGISKQFRVIEVSRCVQHLLAWKDAHPEKENPDALLWPNVAWGHAKIEPLTETGTLYILRKIAKNAGISKPVNCHWFRHSSATFFGPVYNEMMMRERFGWSKVSKMPSRYCHESGEHKKYREVMGIEEGVKAKPVTMPELPTCKTCGTYITEIKGEMPEICPRCNTNWNTKTITEADMNAMMEQMIAAKFQAMKDEFMAKGGK